MKIAELNVFLAAFLLGEEGAEGVELDFGWIALAGDVHLVVPTVDKVGGNGSGESIRPRGWGHEAQADMALQSVAVGAAGGRARQEAVAVNRLAPPRPQVLLCVMVIKDEHDESPKHAIVTLLQQCLTANEVCVLVKLDSELSPTLQRGGEGIKVLTPESKEFLDT